MIRREIEIFPGEAFNRTKYEESARNLRLLNFFTADEKGVEPSYIPAENGKDVNIVYKVNEKQTGMASVGGGYSERDKLVFLIEARPLDPENLRPGLPVTVKLP